MHRKMRRRARQLPITGSAHKARVIGDLRIGAVLVLAARDMAAERRRAAVLDRRHIGAAFQQMGRKAVAQGVQRHTLPDPGGIRRLVEQPVELAGRHRPTGPTARKQPAFLHRRSGNVTRRARFPPLAQQIEQLRRQHDIAVLAAFGLLNANDLLRAVDMLDLEPDHLASTQAAAVAETEQHAHLEVPGDGQEPLGLVRAHHQRNLLRLTQVIDLGRKIQSPQRHAQQEPHPSHDLIAGTDAQPCLGEVQLEQADILRRSRLRGSLEKCREPLAAPQVASLRARTKLARVHVLDHALTQRADGIRTHGKLLSWMRLKTPRSSRQGVAPATDDLSPTDSARDRARRAAGYRASDLVRWPIGEESCPRQTGSGY